ncbi:MAG: hypothetical protein JNK82_39225, partial [Myxococcaceae bacterium]|nr:hypothetical protein [Myxococcaceae bacterium]
RDVRRFVAAAVPNLTAERVVVLVGDEEAHEHTFERPDPFVNIVGVWVARSSAADAKALVIGVALAIAALAGLVSVLAVKLTRARGQVTP